LDRDGAFELQGGGQQTGGDQQLAQQLTHRGWILLGRHHVAKGLIQLDQLAADLMVFK